MNKVPSCCVLRTRVSALFAPLHGQRLLQHARLRSFSTTEAQKPESEEDNTSDNEHEEEVERLKSEIELWKREAARIQADAYNNAERLKREKKNADLYAIRTFAKALLPVVDVLEGIELTHKNFISVLEKHNIHKIPTTGTFSPNLHEVVFQVPSEEPAGTIQQVLTTGYKIGDQTLRGSKVSISQGPPDEQEESK